jgi:hypothetical protein
LYGFSNSAMTGFEDPSGAIDEAIHENFWL